MKRPDLPQAAKTKFQFSQPNWGWRARENWHTLASALPTRRVHFSSPKQEALKNAAALQSNFERLCGGAGGKGTMHWGAARITIDRDSRTRPPARREVALRNHRDIKFYGTPGNPGIWIIGNGGPTPAVKILRHCSPASAALTTQSPTSRLPSTPPPVVVYDGGRRASRAAHRTW